MTTATSLGYHGDREAPVGSHEWALALREDIRSSWSLAMLDSLMFNIGRMAESNAWSTLLNKKGVPFKSLSEFLAEKPMEGIGMDIGRVEEVIRKLHAPAEMVERTPAVRKTGRPEKGTKNVPLSKGGTDRLAARIKAHHPEIAEAVARGEFKSMRQAGIAAGIVKVPTTLDVLVKAWAKASDAERAAFMARASLVEAAK